MRQLAGDVGKAAIFGIPEASIPVRNSAKSCRMYRLTPLYPLNESHDCPAFLGQARQFFLGD